MAEQSKELKKAIAYETKKMQEIPQETRPDFHLTAPVGWINDPNGFSLYQGEYHLFYQYHPYSTQWGPMHWGHYKTKDFITWEQLPCALAPDTEYDGQGCFSSTAIEHEGKHILIYTSVTETEQEDGSRLVRQTQSIAVGDGVTYEKAVQNPVITAVQLPKGSSPVDFRDPKIWKEGEQFLALVGSKNEDGSGQLALFSSADAVDWKFEKILDFCRNRYGKMWECPDFFSLDGRQMLIVSPQFMRAEGMEFHNGNNSIYFIGDYDEEKKEFSRNCAYSIDYGMDFYAPQTVETLDGRRVMIGWLQSWDNYMTPEELEWSGMMTIPRELHIRKERLVQVPVRELENYRKDPVMYPNVVLQDETKELEEICGRCLALTVEVERKDLETFSIALACDESHKTVLSYENETGIFTTDRTDSGLRRDMICRRSMQTCQNTDTLKLRIVMDKYSIEVFVNDGEQAMTTLIFTRFEANKIRFSCTGKTRMSVEKYDLVKAQ